MESAIAKIHRIATAFAAVIVLVFSASAAAQKITGPPDLAEIQPLIPPGISDFNLEVFGKLAYTWSEPDSNIVEILGNFSARLGPYRLSSRDGVIWLAARQWQGKTYLDLDVFLWQDAETIQPAGTVERGPALLVTLRTFGKLLLNADGHAGQGDAESDLFKEATKARRLLSVAPAAGATDSTAPVVVAPSAEKLALAKPKERKQVGFSVSPDDGQIYSETIDDQPVVIAINDVTVFQGTSAKSVDYVELHADAAVLYLIKEKVGAGLPDLLGGQKKSKKPAKPGEKGGSAEPGAREEPKIKGRERTDREAAKEWVRSVYLEGDVVLMRGQRMIRASRLYYDFEEEKALILDPVMKALDAAGKVPIYVRAERVRQLLTNQYQAEKAVFSTSEFHTPHSSIGAQKLDLTDRTPRNESGEVTGIQAGTYKAYSTTLNVEGLPIAYWPFSAGDFSTDRQAFRSAKFGYNDHYGYSADTRWYLFNLLGLEAPKGWDATLKLDYFSKRGPAFGIDMEYQTDNYYGLLNTYYIHDDGKDHLGPERSEDPPNENRGRALWRHRQFLPKEFELTLEASYLSDMNFLESYERREFENGKDQETLVYLLKRKDNWQFSTLLNYRINDFQTQTEHMPDATFSLLGEPLGKVATLYNESHLGVVRYRYNGQGDPFKNDWGSNRNTDGQYGLSMSNPFAYESSGSVLRGTLRDELRFPVPDFGPLKLNPFVTASAAEYDDGPNRIYRHNTINNANVNASGGFPEGYKPPYTRYHDSGNLGRVMGLYGVEGNVELSKVDDSVESEILDLHHLRHIMKPDFALWNAHSNQAPDRMTPFDAGIEDTSDAGGGTMGLRQRIQTQRGGPGNWRTVDWITMDVEAGFFDHKQRGENTHGDFIASRPEDSISSNFVATNLQYRLSDSTVIIYDNVFDTNRGNLGTSALSIAVEREPRLAWFGGWRYIHDTNSNLLAGGANYKLSEKHSVGIREVYDIDLGRNYTTEIVYVKKWPRWYTAIAFDVDKALDEVGINFSIWPEGTPRLGLGSKRYTGLADSVGMQLR